jgi:hypothetical protein
MNAGTTDSREPAMSHAQRLSTRGWLLLAALLCTGPASAADGTDIFKQWEKQQPVTRQTTEPTTPDGGQGGRQGRSEAVDFGDFLPVYSNTVKYAEVEKALRASQSTEKVAQALNEVFALPTNIRIGVQECGQINAYYDGNSRSIITCYELLEELSKRFFDIHKDDKKALEAFTGAYMFIFFHELGHALITVWNLPITGKEEDAVDQLASYILIQMGKAGVMSALDAAVWFGLTGDDPTMRHYADEHSLSQQRYFNILCWIYGSDPEYYKNFLTEDLLPKPRAQRCPGEFAQLSKAWEKLLDPFLKR